MSDPSDFLTKWGSQEHHADHCTLSQRYAAEKSRCLSPPYHPGSRGPRARNRHRFRSQPAILLAQRDARDRPRTLAEAPSHGTLS
jgi:hypothetical protein